MFILEDKIGGLNLKKQKKIQAEWYNKSVKQRHIYFFEERNKLDRKNMENHVFGFFMKNILFYTLA